MSDKKIVFAAFAMEDVRQRDLLKGQSLNSKSPFEYIDLSVKERYETDWKDRVQTRIRRSHGVIALVSKDTLTSTGELWEIQCAKDEGKPLIGLWVYTNDRTKPDALKGYSIIEWNWDDIADFIDSL
jgi:hypothetical protein